MAVDADAWPGRSQAVQKSRSQAHQPIGLVVEVFESDLDGFGKADDTGHVESPRPPSLLVPAAVHLQREPKRRIGLADIERADALGSIELMAGEGGQIDVHR